jgi:HSP20 family protein
VLLPDRKKRIFKLIAFDDMLTISAEHEKEIKEDKEGRFNRRSINYTSWTRSFTLPENCNFNKIEAEYKNGELKIMIPKMEIKEPEKIKSISIN